MQTWTIGDPTTLTFDPSAIRRVRVRAISGTVHIVGTDEQPSLEISEISGQDLRVRLDDGGTLDIGYDKSRWMDLGAVGFLLGRGGRTRVQLALAVPHHCPIDAQAVAGSAMISAIRGHVRIRGVSSDATLVGLSGDVEVDTVSGTIEAERITGELHAKTISGDITVVDMSGSRLAVDTVSGAVALDLADPLPDSRIDTVSGDATARVPYGCSLDARLSTTSGQVASTFPEVKLSGWPGAKSAEGRIGSGGPVLRAHTVSGHVTLLGRNGDHEAPQAGPTVADQDRGEVR